MTFAHLELQRMCARTSLFDDCLEQNVHAIVEIYVLAELSSLRIEIGVN